MSVAACGMCGIDYVFPTAKQRFEWMSGHSPSHHDFVSYWRCENHNGEDEINSRKGQSGEAS